MTTLDAYALIGFLGGETCADEVEALLRAEASLSAVNLAEVVDRMARVHDVAIDTEIDELVVAGLRVVPFDAEAGHRAGALRARHYHRTTMPLSLADCAAAATALAQGAPLATSDEPLARLVRAEGGTVVALPDSTGTRPTA